ncbi:ATP-binding protein [Pedobacter gandavensis]|uniref:AAA family ATPase n=1 Tax=Pedobacter gandavensis TaxID=2679963 RepID=UPI00292DF63E|nr:ATP-binding protein [Pedobacter gandavensis]
MIINFSISNYRSVKDKVTLSFEPENSTDLGDYYFIEPCTGQKLLKLALIYGSNGSGKTTLLKGLSFLRALILTSTRDKHEKLNFWPFLFDEKSPKDPSKFELMFIANGVKYFYEISFTTEAIIYERLDFYSPNKSLVFERTTDQERQLSFIKFGAKAKIKKSQEAILEANTLWNSPVLNGFLKTNVDSNELRNVTDWFLKVLKSLISPNTSFEHIISKGLESKEISKNHVVQFLKKADFKITDLTVEKKVTEYSGDNEVVEEILKVLTKRIESTLPSNGSMFSAVESVETIEVEFQHSVLNNGMVSKYNLPYKEESQGTQRYFQYSGLLDQMLRNPSVVLIDELESSLHPDLVKHFLLLFLVNVKQCQLIATTHYRELLMEREILRDDVIWFTEKKEDGSMELFALSDFDSSIVRDTTSVFNAYKSGKLGAVPQLSDYYINLDNEAE